MNDRQAERRGLRWGLFLIGSAATIGVLTALVRPMPTMTWVGFLAGCAGSLGGVGIPIAYLKGFIPQYPRVTRKDEPVSFFILLVAYSGLFYFMVGYGAFIVTSGW